MLAKVKPNETPNMTPAEAWKRKRPISPNKDVILSAAKHETVKASQVYRRKGGTLTLWKGEVPTLGLPTTLQVNDAIIKSGH